MIVPEKIIERNIKIPVSNGSGDEAIAQTNLHFGDRHVTLLVGPDLLLRFQYKKETKSKTFKYLEAKIIKNKEIFTPRNQKLIQDLLIADREIRELLNKDKKELSKRSLSEFNDFLAGLNRRQKNLSSFARDLDFNIIKLYKEYLCKRCMGFRAGPDLVEQSEKPICPICKNILKKFSIRQIETNSVMYLTGYWFEGYIANILNTLGWKAWSSPNLMIYGVSGASHQIDVLAVKKGRVLIVECKTGEFSPTQVMNLLGKYYDIRCHQALAISIGSLHPTGKKIIEKNTAISYYDNIKNYGKLLKKISQI